MKLKVRKFEKKGGFTIIELLTVMSIIVILFGLLMPAMTLVKNHGKTVKQRAQFHAIEAGMELYRGDFGDYPPSDGMNRNDLGVPIGGSGNNGFPGAIKLAEALMGHDLLGFNPNSIFRADGENPLITTDTEENGGRDLYPDVIVTGAAITDPIVRANLQMRKGPYLDVTRVSTAAINAMYSNQPTMTNIVICDEFPRVSVAGAGKRVGLPVLYYKANVSSMLDPDPNGFTALNDPADSRYIYNHLDNQAIIDLTPAWTTDTATTNPIKTGETPGPVGFYTTIQNPKISSPPKPYNPDTYILMSAGIDGLYGTRDDIFNFNRE
jgi:prepilin-type N-terminal cleavage/methylation domain-containing protein